MGDQPWQAFHGTWNCVAAENIESFLAEVGIPYLVRKMASKASPTCTIKVDGDKMKIQMSTSFKSQPENEFHVNGEMTTAEMEKDKQTAKTTFQDGKLVIEMMASEDGSVKARKISREIINDEMHQTMEIGNVVAKQRFARAK